MVRCGAAFAGFRAIQIREKLPMLT